MSVSVAVSESDCMHNHAETNKWIDLGHVSQIWRKVPMGTKCLEKELRRIKASVKYGGLNCRSKLSDIKEVVLALELNTV